MPEPNHVKANAGDALLLVGTMKGAFVMRANASRDHWEVGGPYFPGRAIYALAYDNRNGRSGFKVRMRRSSPRPLGKPLLKAHVHLLCQPAQSEPVQKEHS